MSEMVEIRKMARTLYYAVNGLKENTASQVVKNLMLDAETLAMELGGLCGAAVSEDTKTCIDDAIKRAELIEINKQKAVGHSLPMTLAYTSIEVPRGIDVLVGGDLTLTPSNTEIKQKTRIRYGSKKDAEQMILDVSRKHCISTDELLGVSRIRDFAWPRQELMWRLHDELNWSKQRIADLIGKERTTINHGIEAHERRVHEGLL